MRLHEQFLRHEIQQRNEREGEEAGKIGTRQATDRRAQKCTHRQQDREAGHDTDDPEPPSHFPASARTREREPEKQHFERERAGEQQALLGPAAKPMPRTSPSIRMSIPTVTMRPADPFAISPRRLTRSIRATPRAPPTITAMGDC